MHNTINLVNSWLQDITFDLTLDEDGGTIIQRDSSTVILIEVMEDTKLCHFYAPVTALSEYTPTTGLLTALVMNQYGRQLGGCWLAWDPEINMLCLCHNLYLPTADTITFSNTLQNFMIEIDKAREALNNPSQQNPVYQPLLSDVNGLSQNQTITY